MNSLQSKLTELRKRTGTAIQEESKLASAYTKLRGSKLFLGGLIALISGWVAAHFIYHLDPDWGGLNLILSSEASIALALYTMIAMIQDHRYSKAMDLHQKTLEYLLEMTAALHAVVEGMAKEDEDGSQAQGGSKEG